MYWIGYEIINNEIYTIYYGEYTRIPHLKLSLLIYDIEYITNLIELNNTLILDTTISGIFLFIIARLFQTF